jgi:lipoprotein-anchoring transpeptidase ErfK/SrfK
MVVTVGVLVAACDGSAVVSARSAPSLYPAVPVSDATPRLASPAAVPSSAAVAVLRPGDRGARVLALQQRLVALGYWLGTPDGDYSAATTHAVTALQKVYGLSRDGIAGPATFRALAQAARPRTRSRTGRVAEIDLTRQVLILAIDGRAEWVLDASTGAIPGTTPAGRYAVLRQVDGNDHGPLGVLYRPKYFVGGVAIHGYPNVPPYPASHGCVRVSSAAMDWLWANSVLPIGQPVWVYQ